MTTRPGHRPPSSSSTCSTRSGASAATSRVPCSRWLVAGGAARPTSAHATRTNRPSTDGGPDLPSEAHDLLRRRERALRDVSSAPRRSRGTGRGTSASSGGSGARGTRGHGGRSRRKRGDRPAEVG
ncbi:CysS/YqeB C-terminal domain-containing protein [Amycolatopsis tucumanensis]|uniref:CysS/YqeB C-terminal domain-containing protein n=1 Tax=Amycolatopsis tucumanensis TaxID=401106 RepID=UPI003CD0B361